MSDTTSPKNYYLVHAIDVPNTQRTKHIPEHMQQNIPLIENGYIAAGGGLLPQGANSSDADARDKLQGSFIVVKAATIEEVWDTLKKDVFYTAGDVWDLEKITVTPVFLAVPKA